jgi:hypothetical protein
MLRSWIFSRGATTTQPLLFPHRRLSTTSNVSRLGKLWLRYSAAGVISLVGFTFAAYQGSHIYVQHRVLRDTSTATANRAAGSENGYVDGEWSDPWIVAANDPTLDWKTRGAVRSAWMSLNWSPPGVNHINRLRSAGIYIHTALQSYSDSQKPPPISLLALYAQIQADIPHPESRSRARAAYDELAARTPTNSIESANAYHSLGRLLLRSGWSEHKAGVEAISKALGIVVSPTYLQSSNAFAARRIEVQSYLDLSTHYIAVQDLPSALQIQSNALERFIPQSFLTSGDESPGTLLHELFIQQRLAALSIQRAELTYATSKARKPPVADTIQLLASAAATTETIARKLFTQDAELYSAVKHFTPAINQKFIATPPLSSASNSLCREIARTIATSYNLAAFLHESTSKDREDPQALQRAYECYEKALWWCGDDKGPSVYFSQAEWERVWGNYVRLRQI